VVGLAWFVVGDDGPSGGTAAGVPATAAPAAARVDGATTAAGSTAGEGGLAPTSPRGGRRVRTLRPAGAAGPGLPERALGHRGGGRAGGGRGPVRVPRRLPGPRCTFWSSSGRYLLVQVSRGWPPPREQYELSRLPADQDVAGIGQAARWTRDTGLLDVLDGPARFQVGLFSAAGTAPRRRAPARLEAAARAVAAHL
jgi:hypothetical protein